MKSELFSACPDRKLSTEWKVFSLFFTRDFPLNPELTLKISEDCNLIHKIKKNK